MILLNYKIRIHWSWCEDWQYSLIENINEFSFRTEVEQMFWTWRTDRLNKLKFMSGDHSCLCCTLSDASNQRNSDWFTKSMEYRGELYREFSDRIRSELMKYERAEFAYKEIVL